MLEVDLLIAQKMTRPTCSSIGTVEHVFPVVQKINLGYLSSSVILFIDVSVRSCLADFVFGDANVVIPVHAIDAFLQKDDHEIIVQGCVLDGTAYAVSVVYYVDAELPEDGDLVVEQPLLDGERSTVTDVKEMEAIPEISSVLFSLLDVVPVGDSTEARELHST